MEKEKIIKTHTRRTKSGKTVTVRQYRAKYDAAEDAKQLAKKIGAGKEFESKRANVFDKDLWEDLLQSNEASEYHKVWDELEKGLNEERKTGKPFSTGKYKNLEKKMKPIKDLLDKKYGKGAANFLENNIYDYVTYNKDGSSSLETPRSKEKSTKSILNKKTPAKDAAVVEKILKEKQELFNKAHEQSKGSPVAKSKQVAQTAPTKEEIAKYKQDWGEDETYRQMKAEYADSIRKKPKSKGIVSSGKDPITEATRKKGKAHLDNIQKSSDQRNSIERPPKTATKPTGVKSPGKTTEPTIPASDFKAWYHWDAAGDPKNKTALAVEKKLRAKMGRSEYNKYFNEMTNSYSSRGHLKAYKALEPETAKAIKSNKMVAGTAEAQKEVAKLQGAKKAEKIFAAKEKEAKGNLNKLSGKGTDKATSDKVINSIVKNYKGASDTVLNRMTKEALAVDDKEGTFSKEWSRTKKLSVLKKGLSTSDLTPEDFTALHKKSLRYAKETPKVVGWEKKNGTEVAKYNTEEKSKPTGMYTRDEFLKEMKSGKIPSLAHRAEPKGTESKYGRSTDSLIKRKAAERHKLSYDKNGYYVDKNGQTYGILGNGYVIKRKYKYTTPNSYFHPDKVSKQVKFKAKEGNHYKMPDGSILTYIGRNVGKGRKGEHRFKDFKTGKIKFKDSDTIYALSEQKKGIPDTNKPRRGPKPPARAMGR